MLLMSNAKLAAVLSTLFVFAAGALEPASRAQSPAERWVGKDVLRDIKRPLVAKRSEKHDRKKT